MCKTAFKCTEIGFQQQLGSHCITLLLCPFYKMALLLGVKHLIHISRHYLSCKRAVRAILHQTFLATPFQPAEDLKFLRIVDIFKLRLFPIRLRINYYDCIRLFPQYFNLKLNSLLSYYKAINSCCSASGSYKTDRNMALKKFSIWKQKCGINYLLQYELLRQCCYSKSIKNFISKLQCNRNQSEIKA